MYLIEAQAFSDFDTPYTVPFLVTDDYKKASKIKEILNSLYQNYNPDEQDKRLIDILKRKEACETFKKALANVTEEESASIIVESLIKVSESNYIYLYSTMISIREIGAVWFSEKYLVIFK